MCDTIPQEPLKLHMLIERTDGLAFTQAKTQQQVSKIRDLVQLRSQRLPDQKDQKTSLFLTMKGHMMRKQIRILNSYSRSLVLKDSGS